MFQKKLNINYAPFEFSALNCHFHTLLGVMYDGILFVKPYQMKINFVKIVFILWLSSNIINPRLTGGGDSAPPLSAGICSITLK